tara:strand:+ start:2122 stop:3387 length:1266 start_codon:yes stop_codon:yes gene_type:complete
MEVSIKKISQTEKEIKIIFQYNDIEVLANKKLEELGKKADLKGFRKGKVPNNVLKEKYYSGCINEALSECIQQKYVEAIIENKLNPIGAPKIKPIASKDKTKFAFTASIEIVPEFEIKNIDKIDINKPNLKISEKDYDEAIKNICKRYTKWNSVEREAKEGDQLKIDFIGKINGEEFPNNKAKDFVIELGTKSFIPGFEEGLIGLKKSSKKKLKLTFPNEYHDPSLSSKKVDFDIDIHEVMEGVAPKVDHEFIKGLGIEDGKIESLKKKISEGMNKDGEDIIDTYLKKQVINSIVKNNKIDLPKSLIDDEISRMKNEEKISDVKKEDESAAKDRVTAGLILRQIIENEKFTASRESIDQWINHVAEYRDNRDEIVKYYNENQAAIDNVKAIILEKQAVDWVINNASISSKDYSFEELIQLI